MKAIIQLLFKYIIKKPKIYIGLFLGISISISLLVSILSISASLKESYIEDTKRTAGFYHFGIVNLDKNKITSLKSDASIDKIGAEVPLGTGRIEGTGCTVILEKVNTDFMDIFSTSLEIGKLPEKDGEIVLEKWIIEDSEITNPIGKSISVKGTFGDSSKNGEGITHFKIVGVIKNIEAGRFSGNGRGIVHVYNNISDIKESENNIFLKQNESLAQSDGLLLTIEKLKKNLGIKKEDIKLNSKLISALEENTDTQPEIIFLFVIIIITTTALIYNTCNINLIDRIKQLGLMRVLGASKRHVLIFVLIESILICSFAVPFGILLSLITTNLSAGVFSRLFSANFTLIPLSLEVVSFAVFTAIITTLISSFIPAIKTSRLDSLEALRIDTLSLNTAKGTGTSVSAQASYKTTRMPYVLKLAFLNLNRNKTRTIISISSLSLCVTIFILFSYVSSFTSTKTIVDAKIPYDYRLLLKDEQEIGITQKDLFPIESNKSIKNIYLSDFNSKFYTQVSNKNLDIEKFPGTYISDEKKLYIPTKLYVYSIPCMGVLKEENKDIDIKDSKNTIYIYAKDNNSIIEGLSKGDIFQIASFKSVNGKREKSKSVSVQFGGYIKKIPFSNDSFLSGINMVIRSDFASSELGINKLSRVDVELADNPSNDTVIRDITKLSKKYNIKLESQEEEYRSLEDSKKQMKLLLYCLIFIIALISALNIYNTIKTGLITRKREYGILRAIGMSKSQIYRMVLSESLFYGIASSVIGLLSGIIFTFLLYSFAYENFNLGSWGIQTDIFVLVFAFNILLSLIACVSPMRKTLSLDVNESINNIS